MTPFEQKLNASNRGGGVMRRLAFCAGVLACAAIGGRSAYRWVMNDWQREVEAQS
jgi:hypothetical protein